MSLIKIQEERCLHELKLHGYRGGKEIERKMIDLKEIKGEEGFYPLKALVHGVVWPEDVDPCKREEYLSEKEFYDVFQMEKKDFKKLQYFVRIRLKKELSLF